MRDFSERMHNIENIEGKVRQKIEALRAKPLLHFVCLPHMVYKEEEFEIAVNSLSEKLLRGGEFLP